MSSEKDKLSWVERLVLEHSQGTVPAERTLDTPAKIQCYVDFMTEATDERLREDRRAQQASLERARTRRVS